MNKNIFGNIIQKETPLYIEEKMNPFELVELITRYNYLSITNEETFYYTMKEIRGRYYTNNIYPSLEKALKAKEGDAKVFEKKVDYNLLYIVIKIMYHNQELMVYANVADNMMQNLNSKSILMMLEQEIPKKKYYIKYKGLKKNDDKLSKLIKDNLRIGTKDFEDLLDILELQEKIKEFYGKFEEGK